MRSRRKFPMEDASFTTLHPHHTKPLRAAYFDKFLSIWPKQKTNCRYSRAWLSYCYSTSPRPTAAAFRPSSTSPRSGCPAASPAPGQERGTIPRCRTSCRRRRACRGYSPRKRATRCSTAQPRGTAVFQICTTCKFFANIPYVDSRISQTTLIAFAARIAPEKKPQDASNLEFRVVTSFRIPLAQAERASTCLFTPPLSSTRVIFHSIRTYACVSSFQTLSS